MQISLHISVPIEQLLDLTGVLFVKGAVLHVLVFVVCLNFTQLLYSTKLWRGNILADLTAITKNLPSKLSTLNSNANYGTALLPKYYHSNVSSSFIH